MNGKWLLDTNIIIALFSNDQNIIAKLQTDSETFVPVQVLGELYYGARNSGRVIENVNRIQRFEASSTILSCDAHTASIYGSTKQTLKRLGRPIPENDIWIAALALQYGFTLVSRDRHFQSIPDLLLEAW